MSKAEIVAQFGPEAESSEIVSSLQDLSKIYALTIEDLYIKWEQFSYQKHENRTELNASNLDSFKKFLQLQMEKKAAQASPAISNPTPSGKPVKPIKPLHSSPSLFGYSIPKGSALKKRKLNTEAQRQEKGHKLEFSDGSSENQSSANHGQGGMGHNSMTNTPPESSGTSQATATCDHESGKILTSLNPEKIETAEGLNENSREKVQITPFYDPERYKFRTMRQNLSDAADVLDLQIETTAKIIQDHYDLSPSDFGDPSVQAQSEIHAVGRIVPDSTTTEEFLNMESLALETSRLVGVGRRIRLDLTDIDEVSLFCGQIVAIRGKNANGDSFKVNEVLALPYPNSPVSTLDELQKYRAALEGKPLKVLATNGPYFSDSFDLHFLEQFVERVNSEIKPHVLILFGPFIDVTDPMIAKGAIPHFPHLKNQPNTLDEIFTKVIAPVLKRIRQEIQVILIPSTRDAISKHASYPQDSYNRKYLQLPKNFKCFVNPATFQLNEVFFGCSNVDTYKDMKEMTKGGNTSMRNRFDRVSEHILQQRRFYPVFPGGIKKKLLSTSNDGKKVYEHISGADLEVPYLGLTEFVGNFTPDIIIIPSEMHHFARVGQNVVMINPGRFIGHNGKPGTYAEISITSPDLENGNLTKVDGPEPTFLHNVWKRARVDIVTI